jgi:protein-S-isoprenylcysteine O-methyltransferase Ste14
VAFESFKALAGFIAARRVTLSIVLFGLMIALELSRGAIPRSPFARDDLAGPLGGILVLCGLALRSWAAGILRKGSEITSSGPYRLVRNPLYAGSFLMMIGFALLIASPLSVAITSVPIVLIYIITIRSEERRLAASFPQQWEEYARSTPRLIPRWGRVDLTAHWKIGQWLRHREYQAVIVTIVALAAMELWHATLGRQ